jgi:hypothetical protein
MQKMKKTLLLTLFVMGLSLLAAGAQPSPAILGIRLGMPYEKAHAKLNKIAQFKSEDEGQQVWTLNHDSHFQHAIIGFDRDRKVRYVTVLARTNGQPVNYEDIGNLSEATRSGSPGNLRYTWKLTDTQEGFEYEVTARGSDPHHLTRYSIKRLGVKSEEADRD